MGKRRRWLPTFSNLKICQRREWEIFQARWRAKCCPQRDHDAWDRWFHWWISALEVPISQHKIPLENDRPATRIDYDSSIWLPSRSRTERLKCKKSFFCRSVASARRLLCIRRPSVVGRQKLKRLTWLSTYARHVLDHLPIQDASSELIWISLDGFCSSGNMTADYPAIIPAETLVIRGPEAVNSCDGSVLFSKR